MLPGPAVPGCSFVSFYFLWAILWHSTGRTSCKFVRTDEENVQGIINLRLKDKLRALRHPRDKPQSTCLTNRIALGRATDDPTVVSKLSLCASERASVRATCAANQRFNDIVRMREATPKMEGTSFIQKQNEPHKGTRTRVGEVCSTRGGPPVLRVQGGNSIA